MNRSPVVARNLLLATLGVLFALLLSRVLEVSLFLPGKVLLIIAICFALLGLLLVLVTIRQRETGMRRFFLLLTGYSALAMPVSVILHNFIFHAFLFILGVMVLPVIFLFSWLSSVLLLVTADKAPRFQRTVALGLSVLIVSAVILSVIMKSVEEGYTVTSEMISAPEVKIERIFINAEVEESLVEHFSYSFRHSLLSAFESNGIEAAIRVKTGGPKAHRDHEMDMLHIDYWTEDSTALDVYLVSFGPAETSYAVNPVVTGSWQSLDIPLSTYSGVVDLTDVIQMKFVGNGTVYFDNIYFYDSGSGIVETGLTGLSAPVPSVDANSVISVFSDVYTDPVGVDYNPDWGQTTVTTIETDNENRVLKLANLDYQGIDFVTNGAALGVSGNEIATYTADGRMDLIVRPLLLDHRSGRQAIVGTLFDVSLSSEATGKRIWQASGKVDYIGEAFFRNPEYRAHYGMRKEFAWHTTAAIVRTLMQDVYGRESAPVYTDTESRQRHGQRTD